MRKLDPTFIKAAFNSENYTLLCDYINNKSKLLYRCPNGHEHSITWNSWKNGSRCPYCEKLGRPDIDYIRKLFESEGHVLLSTEYVNAKSKLIYICKNGHLSSTTWSNWSNKSRPRGCKFCAGTARKTIEFISKNIELDKYKLINDCYINARSKLHLICPNNHDYFVTWDNWYTKNNRCPKCALVGVSKSELKFRSLVSSITDCELVFNTKEIIAPYELDMFIPDKQLAIEYCGLYWHSDAFKLGNKYHLNKLELCSAKNIRLITVFEDEFLTKEPIVESRLRSILNPGSLITVYARKCVINEISSSVAREFCVNNHLQKYASSSIKLGAFYNGVLVAVMTFSRPSISKGSTNYPDGVWELSRFCSKIGYRIVGMASKMLRYFECNYKWSVVFSYADRRWSVGDLYERIGFEYTGVTKPNYWYFNNNTDRIHRFNLRKRFNDPANKTEFELRTDQGYYRIWDCGNLKFTKHNI